MICKVQSRTEAEVIEDGAVFQRDGEIVEVGSYQDLAKRNRADEVIGSSSTSSCLASSTATTSG